MSVHRTTFGHMGLLLTGSSTFPAWLKGTITPNLMVLMPSHAGHAHRWLPAESILSRGHLILKLSCRHADELHACLGLSLLQARCVVGIYTTPATITIITVSNIAQHLVKSMSFI